MAELVSEKRIHVSRGASLGAMYEWHCTPGVRAQVHPKNDTTSANDDPPER